MATANRIRVLPADAVNKVAAGEVVERPAAALKELLENAIDAGARRLTVELARAGKSLLRVTDDGSGMTHDEALLALERHATSKIRAVEDLSRITTLGFRGEALPSIASVSRFRLTTRARGESEGTRVVVEGGRVVEVAPCGCPEGTEVEVRDLFHNMPARLKFLKSDPTELTHCLQVASRLALSWPALGVRLVHGDKPLLALDPAPDFGTRLRQHLGRDFCSGLIPVRAAAGALALDGFVSRPGAGRPGAEYQQFFVNARPVRDNLLLQAVKEACRDHYLQEGSGLSFFLRLTLPQEDVDVNVHPTKREVRFRDLGSVRQVLGDALRDALREDRTGWLRPTVAPPLAGAVPTPAEPDREPGPAPAEPPPRAAEPPHAAYRPAPPVAPSLPFAGAARGSLPGEAAAPVTAAVPGQLFGTYIVTLREDGLVLVDQHAAHERVLYERLLAHRKAAQLLLHPIHLDVAPGEEDALERLRPGLADLGIEIEPFGPRAFRVCALPEDLAPDRALLFLRELIGQVLSGELGPRVEDFRHRAAALLACHAAIRAHQPLQPAQVAELLRDLARTENPAVCPHGRPTAVTLSQAEIEKRFRRT
jgi:DNA mismatch repair protein MutL